MSVYSVMGKTREGSESRQFRRCTAVPEQRIERLIALLHALDIRFADAAVSLDLHRRHFRRTAIPDLVQHHAVRVPQCPPAIRERAVAFRSSFGNEPDRDGEPWRQLPLTARPLRLACHPPGSYTCRSNWTPHTPS